MISEVINPIRFSSQVNDQFLNYQMTAFPLTDPDLSEQARVLLRGPLGKSPLIKGPYISLSKSFKVGRDLNALAKTGVVHPALPGLTEFPVLFAHQDETLKNVQAGRHCLVATGTGSGKTESFLYPILDHCLRLRDAGAPAGVVAVLVYPMNALAIDQLERLRKMLAGSGISFGMYVGSTPADETKLSGSVVRMKPGEGKQDLARYTKKHKNVDNLIISPPEECLTEKEMAEKPPRLLLTNVNQLELLLTRGKDLGMFVDAPLKYLVFDEAHTYTGAIGAEVACLIRRLRAFCGKGADEVICIGTSATVADPKDGGTETAEFARRFFGVDPGRVALIREEYQTEEFPKDRFIPVMPVVDCVDLLEQSLQALERGDEKTIRRVVKDLTGYSLTTQKPWPEALYDLMKKNQYVYEIFHQLEKPLFLPEAVQLMAIRLGRDSNEVNDRTKGELLCYLVLGAAAENSGNPLLRPKVHYFVKGLEGAVIAFSEDTKGGFRAELFLNLKDALTKYPVEKEACPPVLGCSNCGQHYLEGFYSDLCLENGSPTGGVAEGENVIWEPADEAGGGSRIVLTNRFISEEDGSEEITEKKLDKKRSRVYFCRHCGTLHRHEGSCHNPKCKRVGDLVPLWMVTSLEKGKLTICPSCGQRGRRVGDRVIEPVRAYRAITVSDVHIIAQNMVNAVHGPQQKLIVFTDNRQDAAFQAGWMQDHARRYRFRHLIYDYLCNKTDPVSITDIKDCLLKMLREDRALGMALAPEVYTGRMEEAFGKGLGELLDKYLRIMLVREFAAGFKQRDSLESWGMMRVVYAGIDKENSWIKHWSQILKIEPEVLAEGIAALLDSYRRTRFFYDEQEPIYSRYWHESSDEVQRGFLPLFDFPPKGLKERKEEGDNEYCISYLRSNKGQTRAEEFVAKWGIDKKQLGTFMDSLWYFLVDEAKVLINVSLKGSKGATIKGTVGTYQIDSRKVGALQQKDRYRCNICQRIHTRNSPNGACTGWLCKGRLIQEEPPEDDYNISMLNLPFSMLMAREHSAQVPASEREKIEDEFKDKNGRVNCLVATPTLELGVDIGALDMVLMRNVPPKPANYWQRAGRAGRRHRMAVIFTYCRRSNHDSYFFEDPLYMLDGRIETPRFNLRNDVMIRKHVHAAVVSEMIRLSRGVSRYGELSEDARLELSEVKQLVFPSFISTYLFLENQNYRTEPYDVLSRLSSIIDDHGDLFSRAVKEVFATYWPSEDAGAIQGDILKQYIKEMPDLLQETVNRLHKRMMWSVNKRMELIDKEKVGLLDELDRRLRARCERYVQQLAKKEMSTYTLTVLAVEGFLPGYGIYEGSVRAYASRTFSAVEGRPDFELPRPASIAIREFIPGNVIYANGGRFKTTLFHFPVGQQQVGPERYVVDTEHERIMEAKKADSQDGQYGGVETHLIPGLPICDTDISYLSRITDEENNRFQLPVTVMGYLKKPHRGIRVYKIANREVQHRFGQHARLLNVGPADKVRMGDLGYPVCTVCGATRSPYASAKEMEHFEKYHKESCGKTPEKIAISADIQVDGLLFQGLKSKAEAVNLAEALRIGSSQVLEMDNEDLQYLPLPQADQSYHLFLYDPMPGGSGLLQQIIAQWQDVLGFAMKSLAECHGKCEKSCYSCMRTYRNVFVHPLLDRFKAVEMLSDLQDVPAFEREMEPVVESEAPGPAGNGSPTNRGEHVLGEMLERAGFPEFKQQHEIKIGPPFHRTVPDLYYEDALDERYIAVYLDGLSSGIHGRAERVQIDRMIREQLEANGIDVIEIASSDLNDPELMRTHFKRVAAKMKRKDIREKLDSDISWFRSERGD